MGPAYAVHGATTTHGGQIQSTQRLSRLENRYYLVEGDHFFCPTCRRISKFMPGSGDSTWIIDGRAAILNGTMLSCGAKVVEMQLQHVKELTAQEQAGYQRRYTASVNPEQTFNDRLRILVEDTNEPASHLRYSIKRANGSFEDGITDQEGYTHLLSDTLHSEEVELYTYDDE